MRKLFKISVLSICAMFFFWQCKTKQATVKKVENSKVNNIASFVKNQTWILQDENGNVKGNGERYVNIVFSDEASNVTGFGGCNSFSGTAKLEDKGIIAFEPMMQTKVYCARFSQKELTMMGLIQKTNRYEVSKKELRFFHDKIELMRFKKQ